LLVVICNYITMHGHTNIKTLAALSRCLYAVVREAGQCLHSVPQGRMMKMCS